MLFRRIVRIHNHVLFVNILGQPLICTGRALDQLPIVFEQNFEITHVPFGRMGLPGALDAAADGITAFAAAEAAFPSESLLLDWSGFRLRSHMGCRTGAVALAEGVPAGNKRNGLFVVHGHACKGLTNVTA